MPSPRFRSLFLFLSWVALGSPGSLSPQAVEEPDTLRQRYLLPVPSAEEASGIVVRANPAFSPAAMDLGSRSYFVVYAGVAYTPRTRYIEGRHDGNGLVGVTFGDPTKWLGVQADLGLYSTARRGLFQRVGLSLEVSRYLPGGLILSAGWENLISNGNPDTGESQYGVLSRWFRLRQPDEWLNVVGVSVGMGNGRFVKESNWIDQDTNELNFFGSMTLQVAWPTALVVSWQGDDLTAGLAITPLQKVPLVITPAVYNATGRVKPGASFMISALYAYRVK